MSTKETKSKYGFARVGHEFVGKPNTMAQLLTEIKSAGNALPALTLYNTVEVVDGEETTTLHWEKYIFPIRPHVTDKKGMYVRPAPFARIAYDSRLCIPEETPLKQRNRLKTMDVYKKHNTDIDTAVSLMMDLIRERCNTSFESTWQKLKGDPYLCMQFLITNYGDAVHGAAELGSSWEQIMALKMSKGVTFPAFLNEVEIASRPLNWTDEDVFGYLCMTKSTKNPFQPLADHLMPALQYIKTMDLCRVEAMRYLARQDMIHVPSVQPKPGNINAIGSPAGANQETPAGENQKTISAKRRDRHKKNANTDKTDKSGFPAKAARYSKHKAYGDQDDMHETRDEDVHIPIDFLRPNKEFPVACDNCGLFNHLTPQCKKKPGGLPYKGKGGGKEGATTPSGQFSISQDLIARVNLANTGRSLDDWVAKLQELRASQNS